jgi:hypothetical protein
MRTHIRWKVAAVGAAMLVLAGVVVPQQPKALDIAKPATLKHGAKGRLKGKFEVFAVNPLKDFPQKTSIKVGDRFLDANHFNGTVRLSKGTDPAVLLKIDTKGREVGGEVEFDGPVTVERHGVETAVDVDGKLVKVVTTTILLTPAARPKKK